MMRRLPNLTALRAFEAAARHESLTRAAEELNVAHPALSRQIRELEGWLGCPLFHRHNRGLSLTDAGRAYRDAASQAFDLIDAATGLLRPDAPAVGEQRLTLSVEPSFAQRWLVPRLGAFRALHPGVTVIVDATREAANFRRGGADLGIRYGSGPWPGLEARKLADVENFPVCAPGLTPLPSDPADLLDMDLLLEETDLPWQAWFAAVGITLNRPLHGTRFFDASHAMDVAVAGQGVALGDTILSRDDLAAGRLIRPFPQAAIYQSYSLVAPPAHFRRPAVKAFAEWALAAMAAFQAG
ncbi:MULTISPECIES: transcriptional regulator GcvA [unclassified Azospirillum]|uniref:transcriptional regulator GcvA n=1 Tax=unclassified Azospirillum TaxID=2630922 RepID=UPI000B7425F6|nr:MULTISPECIES: transcriptional regulator GcvA [unclassified Azospirillum]SNR83582.1 LysR family transcriptional regulator, glycine cleavage system transcriptional activator [Azospirillum sp. RU38E]SNR99101.1 LysR family transcriptional regulator, glycine cleavage system transcriptional activator [Azospirillum sp. RU37A]